MAIAACFGTTNEADNQVLRLPKHLPARRCIQRRTFSVSTAIDLSACARMEDISSSHHFFEHNPLAILTEDYAGRLRWSSDGQWLATVGEGLPRVVWLWEVPRMRLHSVIVHTCAVQGLEWRPGQAQLAVTTNTPCLYLWTPEVGATHWQPTGCKPLAANGVRVLCHASSWPAILQLQYALVARRHALRARQWPRKHLSLLPGFITCRHLCETSTGPVLCRD